MTVLAVHAGIITGGVFLDEAGKGTFGQTLANLATKVTNGFGV